MISIAVIDDHPLVLKGVEALTKEHSNYRLVGSAATGPAGLELCNKFKPDILLLDLSLRGMDGLEVLRQLNRNNLSTKVIIVTNSDSVSLKNECLSLGALGYIWKVSGLEVVEQAIVAVINGDIFIDQVFSDGEGRLKFNQTSDREDNSLLTRRESEVLQALCEGRSTREIALKLNIMEQTVYSHFKSIYTKLEVTNRQDAIKQARALKLVKPLSNSIANK